MNNHCTKQAFLSTVCRALYPPTSHHLCHTYLLRKCQSGGEVGQIINTYCGSSLFTVVLSLHFDKVAGIELSPDSICYAMRNAKLNNISEEKISFFPGNAGEIFATVRDFPADDRVVLIDPLRGRGVTSSSSSSCWSFAPRTDRVCEL